jgi:ABC-type transport system involved in multi-copper enzyme maturation permease subunit
MRDCVKALARSTFLEALRDRVLLVVAVFALALVLFSRVLGWLSIEDEIKLVQDFSLSGMSLLSLFLAMLVGAFSLAREVDRKTACTVLARDIGRGEFILGKFLGLVAVFWLVLLGAAVFLVLWLFLWGGTPRPALLAAVLGLLCEALLLTAVAMFLGSLSSATVAAVGTFAFYLVGHSLEALREMTGDGKSPEFAGLYRVLYRLLPNLEDVNFINATGTGHPVAWGDLGLGALAMAAWTAVFLLGTAFLFRRREL